jgi:curved DNA-binding protein CbpA
MQEIPATKQTKEVGDKDKVQNVDPKFSPVLVALDIFGNEISYNEIRSAYRKFAKNNHPDVSSKGGEYFKSFESNLKSLYDELLEILLKGGNSKNFKNSKHASSKPCQEAVRNTVAEIIDSLKDDYPFKAEKKDIRNILIKSILDKLGFLPWRDNEKYNAKYTEYEGNNVKELQIIEQRLVKIHELAELLQIYRSTSPDSYYKLLTKHSNTDTKTLNIWIEKAKDLVILIENLNIPIYSGIYKPLIKKLMTDSSITKEIITKSTELVKKAGQILYRENVQKYHGNYNELLFSKYEELGGSIPISKIINEIKTKTQS